MIAHRAYLPSATNFMRIVVAILAVGTLTSCLAGERQRATAQEGSGSTLALANSEEAIRLLNTRCTMCHSTDLITQQRLNESKWRTEIKKMIRWGAYLSSPEQALLVSYLASRYHTDAPDTVREEGQGAQSSSPAPGGLGTGMMLFAELPDEKVWQLVHYIRSLAK
ncbi:MAG: c-type cytochrome [Nitrospiraceae bacterium]